MLFEEQSVNKNGKSSSSYSNNEFLARVSMSLSNAMEPHSSEAKIICHSSYPQSILYANRAWKNLTGFEQHEVEGSTLSRFYGPLTVAKDASNMMKDIRSSGYAEAQIVNYRRSGEAYFCSLTVHPVVSKDFYEQPFLSHFVVVVRELPMEIFRAQSRGSSSAISQLTDSCGDSSGSEDHEDGDRSEYSE